MPIIYLQIWGGVFFLLNKLLFSVKERQTDQGRRKSWHVWSWTSFIIGVPAWLIIYASKDNWIALGLTASGVPAIVMGIIIAISHHGTSPSWLNHLAKAMIISGIAYSFYVFGGLTTFRQALELSLTVSYLISSYQLAKDNGLGYLWLSITHVSAAWLMHIQDLPWLFWQQCLSLIFVLDAYRVWTRRHDRKIKSPAPIC